jgi:SOS response associated peptidase (SRAP)
MPALTRRRDLEAQDECWHIYRGDVRVGIPFGEDPWGWSWGFYPGCHAGEQTDVTALTFDQARADFEEAWAVFLFHRTEAGFMEWRHAQALTVWKYRMWDTGHRLPTQASDGRSTCFCGAMLTIGAVPDHVLSVHSRGEPMCGRVRLANDYSEIKMRLKFAPDAPAPNYEIDYNKPPTMPMLVAMRAVDGRRVPQMMRWGLIPHWVKPSSR